MKIIIPAFPPSLNKLHGGLVRAQKFYLSKEHKEFRKVVEEAVNGRKFNGEKAQVHIVLYPRDNRRRDIDNYIKGLFDSFTACGFWKDDAIVRRLVVEWGSPEVPPKTVVNVKEFTERLVEE